MKLDHIGIAVSDLDEARRLYGQLLGLEVSEPEELPDRQLRICMVDLGVGGANIELLWPTHPESAVGKFLAKRGPGIHHLCYRVDNVAAKLAELKAAGVRLIDEQPRPGAHHTLVAFIHPASAGGVLTELSQPAP
ncbi:MAG: methylmalonyl-CoA epimerase [Deltaproteobacteria bacterium]|nr:MAG: methylmalonyl-CoA epimerase [Deltaproteobacteria bacterium]